jgi:Ca-activated chloride channel homolog
MAKRYSVFPLLLLGAFSGATVLGRAQNREPEVTVFHVTVNMVQLDVAVTDKNGNYVTSLSPWDFAIYEDGIVQKVATFGEENQAPRTLEEFKPGKSTPSLVSSRSAKTPVTQASGSASVFILFDTSNYMYQAFAVAQDAIADFVRSLDRPSRVAFYSYSRDFSRACLLTSDRSQVMHGIRGTVAGDSAALYDSMLLTLKDAVKLSGRKVIVVFSNGPDDASVGGPEGVRELAQTEGIPIYMVSTQQARLDLLSTAVFERVSATTGGKAYFAKYWKDQQEAFASIRDDLAHLYSLSYYPQPNPNRGWRSITVKLVGRDLKDYRVRTRSGYRPKAVRVTVQTKPSS